MDQKAEICVEGIFVSAGEGSEPLRPNIRGERFTEWDEWTKMELDGWVGAHLLAKTAIQLIR